MMIQLSALPKTVQGACRDLRDGLRLVLGTDLVALWLHGAVTFEDRPRRLGDLDTHALLLSPQNPRVARAIDELHGSIAHAHGVEWDSWYILMQDARGTIPPRHVFRPALVDSAWALHRAHWIAGRYVALHGCLPVDLVQAPAQSELRDALRSEVALIEQLLRGASRNAGHAAFIVWNACRVIYSMRTGHVVVSKRDAACWALRHMPESWHAAVRAAGRVYDDEQGPDDAAILWACVDAIVAALRGEVG